MSKFQFDETGLSLVDDDFSFNESGLRLVTDEPFDESGLIRDPDDQAGFLENSFRGAVDRGADLLSSFFGAADVAADALEEKLQLGGFVADKKGLRYLNGEKYAQYQNENGDQGALKPASDFFEGLSADYVPQETWEDVKEAYSENGALSTTTAGQVLAFGMEQGIKSIPDMIGAMMSLPAYVISRSGEIGDERAANKGKEETEFIDVLESLPFALGSALLERIGAKGILNAGDEAVEVLGGQVLESGLSAVGRVLKEGGKAMGKEGLTETFQEGVIEYLGARLGTDADMSLAEAGEMGLAGFLAGGTFGGVTGTGVAGAKELGRSMSAPDPIDPNTPAAAALPAPDPVLVDSEGNAGTPEQRRQEEQRKQDLGLDPNTKVGRAPVDIIEEIESAETVEEAIATANEIIDSEATRVDFEVDEAFRIKAEEEQQQRNEEEQFIFDDSKLVVALEGADSQEAIDNARGATEQTPTAMELAFQKAQAEQEPSVDDQLRDEFARLEENENGATAEPDGRSGDVLDSGAVRSDEGALLPANESQPNDAEVGRISERQDSIQPTESTTREEIDRAGKDAATSPDNNLREPSDAQREAGNYKMGHTKVGEFDITIEYPRGSNRKGTDQKGNQWERELASDYGYIKRTKGADGENVDVFIGENPDSDKVFVVDQVRPDSNEFDEAKVLMGFNDEQSAREGYLANYADDWQGLGAITEMSTDQFKEWVDNGDLTKPLGDLTPQAEMSLEQINARREEIGEAARSRMQEMLDRNNGFLPNNELQSELQYMTPEEKQEFHELGLKLPSFGEEQQAAKERLKQRVEARRKKPAEKVQPVDQIKDFGEKIGGARKDTDLKTGPRVKQAKDDRPGWRRRYSVTENVAGGDVGKFNIWDSKRKSPFRKSFETEADAEAAIPLVEVSRNHRVVSLGDENFAIVRDVSKYKRPSLKEGFKTRDEAMEYMVKNAVEIIETKTRFDTSIRPELENVRRTGKDHREGEKSTPESFGKQFGFRGVEFGNWNNNEERQIVMDHAYDALQDLASLLDIPAKALSLNGDLALAFGSRGHGLSGASAHYERNYGVINLTKLKGAGALAHEWMHALDHYFSRQDGTSTSEKVESARGGMIYKDGEFMSQRMRIEKFSGVRPEVRKAWKNVLDTILRKSETYVEDNHKVNVWTESAKKRLESEIEQFMAGVKQELSYGKRHTKPATPEQVEQLESLFDKMRRGEGMEEIINPNPRKRYGAGTFSSETLNEISAIFKKVRGRTGLADKDVLTRLRGTYRSYESAVKRAQEAKDQVEKTKTIQTDFVYESKRIDEGTVKDYWSEKHELMARAFESYIEDKVKTGGDESQFLQFGADNRFYVMEGIKPYPEGDERVEIGKAFDEFFKVLEGKETDKGVALYSLTAEDNVVGMGKEDVQAIVDKELSNVTADLDVSVIASSEIPSDLEAGDGKKLKGFIQDGKVFLVHDAITDARDARVVFAHEVKGHLGVNTVVGDTWSEVVSDYQTIKKLGGKRFKSIQDELQSRYGDLDSETEVKEFIAIAAERRVSEGPIGRFMRKVREAFKKGLSSLGFKTPFSMADVDVILSRAEGALQSGKIDVSSSEGTLFSKVRPESAYDRAFNSLGEKDKTVVDKAKRVLKREFKAGGLLPDKVFQARIVRDSQVNAMEFDIAHHLGQFDAAVSKGYGKSYKSLTDKQKEEINEYFTGSKAIKTIPESVRVAIAQIRQSIKGLSNEYVKVLEREAESLEGPAANEKKMLINTIVENMDTYAHRSYQAFDDPNWPSKVSRDVYDKAASYLEGRYRQQNLSEQEIQTRVARTIKTILEEGTAYDNMGAFIQESKLGAKDLSILKARKNIAPEIRDLLGEYKDARINTSKTLTKMTRLVYNSNFLEEVKRIGLQEGFLFTEENKPIDENITVIAAEGSESYSPLNGYYTYEEVNQAFKDALGNEQMADWFRTVVRLNGMVKFGKTVLSPTTAARNWMSAAFFAIGNGHFDMTQMKQSVAGLREYFTHNGDKAKIDYLRKLKELGVVYDTPYAGEMMDLLADAQLEGTFFDSKPVQSVRTGLDYATKFYQYGDDFWKILGFENEKALLMKHKGLSETQAEQEAAERIRNTYPTYSLTGRFVQRLRRFPLAGTFVSFPSEIIRTNYHILRYLKEDMKTHPEYARRKITGLALAHGSIVSLALLTKEMMGLDDDEEEAIRKMSADWQRNSNLAFLGRDENGHIEYLDLSFLDPYNYFKRPINAILRDQPLDDALMQSARELTEPFFGRDIAFGAIMDVLNNKKESGAPVFNPEDKVENQAQDIGLYLWEKLRPGVFNNADRINKALKGEVSSSGKQYELKDEVAGLVGFRKSTFDPKTALYYRSFDFQDRKRKAIGILTQVAKDPNSVSDEALMEAYATARNARRDAYVDMSTIVSAALKSGLSRRETFHVLNRSGISKRDAQYLVRGRLPKWKIDRVTLRNTIRKAELLYGEEKMQEMRRRERVLMKNQNPGT